MSLSLTRRQMLALTGSATLASSLPSVTKAGALSELSIFGPPAGPSVALAHAVATGLFDTIAETSSFSAWRTPDELRAGLTSGSILLSVVPVQAAANLYNRGFPIRLANTMTDGLLYLLSASQEVQKVSDLKGAHIAVPFRGDTPEIILNQLLTASGIDPKTQLKITYTGTPIEAMQMLLSGRVDAALTAEPAATVAQLKGKMSGKAIYRAIDIQTAWGDMTGAAPVLPQAGLALTGTFVEHHGDKVPALLEAIVTATRATIDDPAAAAINATAALGMPAPLLAASIPHCNLVARPATDARDDIERMLSAMAGDNMKKIGGKLPDQEFYLT